MRHTISLVILLATIWLLNSGHYTGLLLALGALSVLLVVFITHRMNVVDYEAQPLHLTSRIFPYHLWLLKKLILANIDVVQRIWLGTKSIDPVMASLPLSQQTDIGRVIYANSITLTPGTITVDLQDSQLTVHALTASGLAELQTGEMDRRVSYLEQ